MMTRQILIFKEDFTMSRHMYGFGAMISKLKKNPKKIVFTEGSDPRILEAASRLLASNFLTPLLVGKKEDVENAAEEYGYNIRGAQRWWTPFASFEKARTCSQKRHAKF